MSPLVAICLQQVVTAPPMGSQADERTCLNADVDVAGRLGARFPDTGLSRGFDLPRLRGELGLGRGGLSVRTSVLAARSGGVDGYVGIAGEALVPVWQVAEARYDLGVVGLSVAAGLVDDIAVMPVQLAWGRVDVARPMGTDRGWLDRSDLGGWVSWTSAESWVTATVSLTSGEGAMRRERNDGLNTTATVRVRPKGETGPTLMAWGREGSAGLLRARNHRVGAAAWWATPWVVVGAEGLAGWGLGGDGALLPNGVSAWARTGPDLPVVGWARIDQGTNNRSVADSGVTTARVGAGPRLPFTKDGPGYLAVGWDGARFESGAAPVAGGVVTTRSDLVFVQLGAHLIGTAWLEGRP